MHAVVIESLEDFLSGTLEPAQRKAIESHLSACSMCREEVSGFEEISPLFACLRTDNPATPGPGFYARVMQGVEVQRRQSFFSFLDLSAARRMAFASLLTMAAIAGFLVSRDHSSAPGYTPDSVMAQQNLPAFDSASPDNMLVTLTSYER